SELALDKRQLPPLQALLTSHNSRIACPPHSMSHNIRHFEQEGGDGGTPPPRLFDMRRTSVMTPPLGRRQFLAATGTASALALTGAGTAHAATAAARAAAPVVRPFPLTAVTLLDSPFRD